MGGCRARRRRERSRLQEDVPDTVYPESHVGWHVDPLARELVQSPTPPFVGAADASHGRLAEHVAAVSVPALHELVPDTVYPESHVGWHVDPLARELVQSPTPPFVGAADASQAFAEHVAAVSVPATARGRPGHRVPRVTRRLARRPARERARAVADAAVRRCSGRIASVRRARRRRERSSAA